MRTTRSAAPAQQDEKEKAIEDGRRFGMDAQSLARLTAAISATLRIAAETDGDGVWPENVEAVTAFYAVTSQWRVVSMSGGFAPGRLVTIGLDYAGVRAGLDAEQIAVTPDLWRDLRIMEDAACAALNEGNG